MALNLSRNTKVFVSSVNGVHASGGSVITVDNITGGSGYSIGDILDMAGGSGSGLQLIVAAVSSGAVTQVYIPNNYRGTGYANSDTGLTVGANIVGSGSGFECDVLLVSGTTTADGSRTATGLFKGNEKDANTFKIGVLDGYSFSQASETSDVTISEAGATPARGSKRFNDSLAPAEWSFQTYARPFEHGAASYRASGTHDFAENILWSALAGQAVPTSAGPSDNSGATTNSAITFEAHDVKVDFESSDAHELLKLNIFFALENTTFRLNDCQVNQVEIDFSIDGIATLSWSGNATSIDQVTGVQDDPSKAIQCNTSGGMTGTNAFTAVSTYVEKYNYTDVTGSNDADYLRNKLSTLTLSNAAQGGGASAGGLDAVSNYDIAITGGSITVANNVTYLTPETLGVVDQSIGSFTGTRTVSGSLTCYLDNKTDGSNSLLTALQGATSLVTNSFDMSLFMGGDTTAFASRTTPVIEFDIGKAHLSIPTIETADIISATVEFAALGDSLSDQNEILIKGHGVTVHSETGYDDTSSNAV